MAATILTAVGGWACVRTGGVTNDLKPDLHWRWTQTPEELLLAQVGNEPVALPATPAVTPTTTAKAAPAAPKKTPAATVAGPD